MPEIKCEVRMLGDDELSGRVQGIEQKFDGLGRSGEQAGARVDAAFKAAGASIAQVAPKVVYANKEIDTSIERRIKSQAEMLASFQTVEAVTASQTGALEHYVTALQRAKVTEEERALAVQAWGKMTVRQQEEEMASLELLMKKRLQASEAAKAGAGVAGASAGLGILMGSGTVIKDAEGKLLQFGKTAENVSEAAGAGFYGAGVKVAQASNAIEHNVTRANQTARLLSSELGIGVPRAFSKFLAASEAMGPILAGMFNVAIVGAFVGIIVELVQKAGELPDKFAAWATGLDKVRESTVKANEETDKYLEKLRAIRAENAQIGLSGTARLAAQMMTNQEAMARAQEEIDKLTRRQENLRKKAGVTTTQVANELVNPGMAFVFGTGISQRQLDAAKELKEVNAELVKSQKEMRVLDEQRAGLAKQMTAEADANVVKIELAVAANTKGLEFEKLIRKEKELEVQLQDQINAGQISLAINTQKELTFVQQKIKATESLKKLGEEMFFAVNELPEPLKVREDIYNTVITRNDPLQGYKDRVAAILSGEDLQKRLRVMQEVEAELAKETTNSKLEELKVQEQIVNTIIPLNDEQREQIEVEKKHLEFAIRAEEIRVRYTQLRADLNAKIQNLEPDDPIRIQEMERLSRLKDNMDKELVNNAALESAEVLKIHRQEYMRMVDSVREGAGQVFDALVSRGQGAFSRLRDWIEGFILTPLRRMFTNLSQMIFAPQAGSGNFFGQLFQGVFPRIAGGGAATAGALSGAPLLASMGYAGGPLSIQQIQSLSRMTSGTAGAAGGLGAFGGAFGTLGLLSGGLGFGAGMLTPGPAWLRAGTGLGAGLLGGAGAITAGLIPGMGAASFGSALSFMSSGGGLFGAGGLFGMGAATIPVLGGLIVAGLLGAKFAQGKNSYQAGGMEASRDFGVGLSSKDMKSWLESKGISESTAYPIRKDIESSPQFLQMLGATAKKQGAGSYEKFLGNLEHVSTAWGTFNFRDAYEIGDLTGDWSALDKAFTDAFQSSEALQKNLPNWKEILTIGGDAAKKAAGEFESLWNKMQDAGEMSQEFADFLDENSASLDMAAKSSSVFAEQLDKARAIAAKWTELKPVIDGFTSMKDALESLSDTLETDIYKSFLETGIITDELKAKIADFGGDLAAFERFGSLISIKNEFEDLKETFLETGKVLPRLRELFVQFGGDLSAFDDMTQLASLREQLADMTDFVSGLKSLLPDLTPLQEILQGIWKADTWDRLVDMGFDPAKFVKITDLIKFERGWDEAVAEFQHNRDLNEGDKVVKLRKGDLLTQAIYKYGGEEGRRALDLYFNKGQNTITQELLDKVKAGMDAEYRNERKSLVDYLATKQQATTDKIGVLEKAITDKLDFVEKAINNALLDAKSPVVKTLGDMLSALNQIVLNTTPAGSNPAGNEEVPHAASGGYVLRSGAAIIHKGETIVPAGGATSGVTVNFYGPVSGVDGIRKAINDALTANRRLGYAGAR